jgi:UDP-GlcNAc:undecaprenyl-phosphate GlcNAc-1-phosphate transferase
MLAQTIVISFVVSLLALVALLWRFGHVALDEPNARSLHERPVPRTGGIAVLAGALAGTGYLAPQLWLPLLMAVCLAAVSFIDDVRGISTAARLFIHLAASAGFVWYVMSPVNPVMLAVLILAVAWVTNLYNFMDGSDGLAGGMAVIGFGAYALAAYLANHAALAAACLALSAAAAGFLVFNFHPARIFLGDVGSIPLGFLAAALGVLGMRDDVWQYWFPLLVFAPFIGDATLTLVKRLIKREKVWQAHREHYYQRMVRMGLGHRGTALAGYALMLLCAALALAGRGQSVAMQAAVFAGACLVLVAVAAWVDVRWKGTA